MIYVEKIPDGCVCGWLSNDDPGPQSWRLVRPDEGCRWSDHHPRAGSVTWVDVPLDTLDEWEIRP